MKNAGIIVLTVLFFAFSGCATSNTSPNITAENISEKPTIFCNVLKEPNPLLIGRWQCRMIKAPTYGGISNDPVAFWLVKNDIQQYALYFHSKSPSSSFIGWYPFIVDGDIIIFSTNGKPPLPGYIKFKIENGKIYFVSPDGQKNEMDRISEK
jgi:hypothetical protein